MTPAGPLLLALAAAGLVAAGATPAPLLSVELAPGPTGPDGRIAELAVVAREPVGTVAAGAPLLRLPLVTSNVETSAATLQGLSVEDAMGVVPLVAKDDPPGPKPYRRWTAARAVGGPITLHYRVPVSDAPNLRGAAPPFELRSEVGTVSGLFGAFLITPDADAPTRLALKWTLPPGGLGVSSLGVGELVSSRAQSPDAWEDTFVMGGRPGREPGRPAPDGFFAAWQGTPPFDASALLRWTHTLYDYDLGFFRSGRQPYSVFLRPNPINAGGGVEVARSFVGTFGPKTDPLDLRITLAHEMVHTFAGHLDTPEGLDGSWYAEGLAVFYERVLPLRAGLIDRAAFLRDLNTTAARYYTDALNDTPNSQIPARFWADTRIRTLPYDRGALYFAEVDAALRKASAGRRSLDDLVLEMLARRRDAGKLSDADWREVVGQALGALGRRQYDDMLAGVLVTPPSDAFGPCFARTTARLRRYELGFAPEVLVEKVRVVRDLMPGSAAQRAGVRNGDRILKPVPQDAIQADQQARLTLEIARGLQRLSITYLPRGETVVTPQWRRVDRSPACEAQTRSQTRS